MLIDPEKEDKDWLTKTSEHFNFYYREYLLFDVTFKTVNIDLLAEEQETGYTSIVSQLGIKYDGIINFYVYPPLFKNNELATSGHANPTYEAVYQTFHGHPFGTHEIVHVIAEQTLGRAAIRLLNEGLAEALTDSYVWTGEMLELFRGMVEYTIDRYDGGYESYIQLLIREGDDLSVNEFYPQAGFFVSYLIGRFGIDKFKNLYTTLPDDFNTRFEEIYGISVTVFENEYLTDIGINTKNIGK
ncbi:hypothetical protein ACFL6G_03580 [candidate division KSB1 bacterium]